MAKDKTKPYDKKEILNDSTDNWEKELYRDDDVEFNLYYYFDIEPAQQKVLLDLVSKLGAIKGKLAFEEQFDIVFDNPKELTNYLSFLATGKNYMNKPMTKSEVDPVYGNIKEISAVSAKDPFPNIYQRIDRMGKHGYLEINKRDVLNFISNNQGKDDAINLLMQMCLSRYDVEDALIQAVAALEKEAFRYAASLGKDIEVANTLDDWSDDFCSSRYFDSLEDWKYDEHDQVVYESKKNKRKNT